MNVITISLGQGGCIDAPLLLGYAGENDVEAVDFDFSAWAEAYGEGSLALELMRASDTAPYPAVLTIDGTVARWTVSDVDTARSGPGVAQLVYKVDGKVKKSMVFKFFVGSSIRESGDEDPWGPILDRMEEILAEVQRQAAAADQSAEAAGGSAQNAEAWAVGERGGEPVPAEDPTHANNAKYYAEQAGETAREFAEETAPAAVQAVNAAGAAAVQAVTTERTDALDAIGTARTGALTAIDTAGRTAVSDVDTAKTGAVQAVNTAKTDAVAAIGNAQTAAVSAVQQEGSTQTAAVQKKGEDALAALQEYADLPGAVDDLKSAVDTKAPAIYSTASGAIASFDDGADGMPLKSLTVDIEPVQEGSGDPSPENVRPISGFTGAIVTRTGKNLLDCLTNRTLKNRGITAIFNADGTIALSGTNDGTAYSAFQISAAFLAKSGIAYILNGAISSNIQIRDVTAGVSDVGNGVRFTGNGGNHNIQLRVLANTAITGTVIVKPMIRLASDEDSVFESYHGNTYTITFPSPDPGTVYGGTLDVVNGKLTVDREIVDLGSLAWMYQSTNTRFYSQSLASSVRKQDNPLLTNGAISSIYLGNSLQYYTDFQFAFATSGNLFVKDSRYTDANDFTSAITGEKLVYPLASPIEIQLSDIPEISTLLGTNNIWADTGDVTVEYAVDTETYVDGNTDAIRDMIAGVETGTTVSKAYSAGDMLIVGNTLYKVIAPEGIASGGTLTPGTNVQVTTAADELADTGNRITALDTQVNADIASLESQFDDSDPLFNKLIKLPDNDRFFDKGTAIAAGTYTKIDKHTFSISGGSGTSYYNYPLHGANRVIVGTSTQMVTRLAPSDLAPIPESGAWGNTTFSVGMRIYSEANTIASNRNLEIDLWAANIQDGKFIGEPVVVVSANPINSTKYGTTILRLRGTGFAPLSQYTHYGIYARSRSRASGAVATIRLDTVQSPRIMQYILYPTNAIETTNTATSTHAVNSFILYNERLYRVTSAITAGMEIIEGTNVEQTSILEVLTALLNA